jgi:hypothetical protein
LFVEREFDNVVINIREMLSANTVITGANIALRIFDIEKFSNTLSILIVSLNTLAKINNGLAAITTRKNQILINNTTANAISGKTIPIATHNLISKSHTFFATEAFVDVSVRCAKSIMEI